ncbi:hypothetical protein GCM10025876_13370 [Demequina litorisediminis]|uniref:ABC transmembrane type-1 domain-containing protein n=1 Tax=Demequina litorisediminis TaxID=1849022 RepID=A0ABQ6IEE7_9MICO|nr:hypothetical protein GCM10025876_13370 [Demequina litorisediminis]
MAIQAPSAFGEISASRRAKNRAMTALIYGAFILAVIPLVWLCVTVVVKGLDRFMISDAEGMDAGFNFEFLNQTMRGIFGGDAPYGGISHAIVGTLMMTLAATLISVPIGLLTAIYLVEYGSGWLQRAITFFVDVMTGIPSIVAGLFAYSLFAIVMGPGTKPGHRRRDRAERAHDPRRGALERGDAAPRAQRACARPHTRWVCRSG